MEKRGRGMGEGVEAEVVRVAASQPSAPPAPASGGGASTTAQASYYQGFTRAKRGHPRQAAGHSIHVVFSIHFIPIGAVQHALFVPESRITNNYWLCTFYYIGVCLSWRETGGGWWMVSPNQERRNSQTYFAFGNPALPPIQFNVLRTYTSDIMNPMIVE